MTKCNHCGKELSLPGMAYASLEDYGSGEVVVATLCCNKPYYIKKIVTFETGECDTDNTSDDFGTLFDTE